MLWKAKQEIILMKKRAHARKKSTEELRIFQFLNLNELLTSAGQFFIIWKWGNWTQYFLGLFPAFRFGSSMKTEMLSFKHPTVMGWDRKAVMEIKEVGSRPRSCVLTRNLCLFTRLCLGLRGIVWHPLHKYKY